jgi:hypothetical protein
MAQKELYEKSLRHTVEMVESGVNKNQILSYLVKVAEMAAGPGAVSSILLLDKDGLLRNGASPAFRSIIYRP